MCDLPEMGRQHVSQGVGTEIVKELRWKGYLGILGEERIKEPLGFNAFF